MKYLILTLLIILALAFACIAQDSLNVMKIGQFSTWGLSFNCYAYNSIKADGDIACVASDWYGLRILDFSAPAQPYEIGYVPFGYYICTADLAIGIDVTNDKAYVGSASGFYIFDISNPVLPVEQSFLGTVHDIHSVHVAGGYGYVASLYGNLSVLLVADPQNPEVVASLDLPYNCSSMVFSGDKMYVVGGQMYPSDVFKFWIIDVADPTGPQLIAEMDLPEYPNDIVVSGNFAYITDDTLRVIDCSDPYNPLWLGDVTSDSPCNAVDIVGNTILFGTQDGTLNLIDVTNPSHPEELAVLDLDGDIPCSVDAEDNLVYIYTYGSGVYCIDITDPSDPQIISNYNACGSIGPFALLGNSYYPDYVYLGNGPLKILEFNLPMPILSATIDTMLLCDDIDIVDDLAFCCYGEDGFRIMDLSDPFAPVTIGSYDPEEEIKASEIQDDYAYCIAGPNPSRLLILDISDCTSPQPRGVYELPDDSDIRDLAVQGDYIHLATHMAGYQIIDVSDPDNPFQVGGIPEYLYVYDITVGGDEACMPWGGYLRIVDISDPANPVEVDSLEVMITDSKRYPTPRYVVSVGGWGHPYANNFLRVIDIGDLHPVEVGWYPLPGDAGSITLVGNIAYVGAGSYFCVFNISGAVPVAPSLNPDLIPDHFSLTAYPNPFNPTTTLTFTLPHSSNVSLDIFDISGRNATSHQLLTTNYCEAGTHSFSFDGRDLSSGIYFVRLQAGEYTNTQKIVLLK